MIITPSESRVSRHRAVHTCFCCTDGSKTAMGEEMVDVTITSSTSRTNKAFAKNETLYHRDDFAEVALDDE